MSEHTYTNELIHETSPYLLQHAHNPVHWNPWGNNALEKAQKENKLLVISIGYSACHWCHVMEHESFEDTSVASIMNEHFVSIKVDREERPDIDQVYMDACQLISGSGGWPLNAIALPDGRPIYAGTYFPKENWKQLLLYFADQYEQHPAEMEARANEIKQGLHVMDTVEFVTKDTAFSSNDRKVIFDNLNATIDYKNGGRAGAPKFPMPVNLSMLLRNYSYSKNQKALEAVTVTLDNMMNGGIYDQIGGGFARYSVDSTWTIPHFEKMLYDNGQLISLYSEAYQLTKDERYKDVVYETIAWIQREMTDKSGGCYSALDADSEGEEGKFYVWTFTDLKHLLGNDFKDFQSVYEITEAGNFDGKNNLVRKVNSYHPSIQKWRETLLAERAKRVRPGLDDKILTSWNALLLKGYVDAYRTFGEQKFLEAALQNANFIKTNCLQSDYRLNRNYKNGKSTINGFLDDYSLTCEAYLDLYQATFDEQWLQLAKHLADYAIVHFYDKEKGVFYYTSNIDAALITRKTETSDNVIPSSNSSIAKALFELSMYFDNQDYKAIAHQQMKNMKETTLKYSSFYANWAMLLDYFIEEPYEVAIVGANAEVLLKEWNKHFAPNCLLLGTIKDSELSLLEDKYKRGETLIYVCKNKSCQLPVTTVEEAIKQVKK